MNEKLDGQKTGPTPLINSSTKFPEKGHTWADLEAEGHYFKQRCPEWHPGPLIPAAQSVLSEPRMAILAVCTCGLMKPVLIGGPPG